MKIYDYIFYRLTIYNLKSEGTLGFASFKSICLINGLLFFNLYSIVLIFKIIGIFQFPEKFDTLQILLFGLFNLFILYLRYVLAKNYNKYIDKYKDENKSRRNINLLKVLLFTIFSLIAPFILVKMFHVNL